MSTVNNGKKRETFKAFLTRATLELGGLAPLSREVSEFFYPPLPRQLKFLIGNPMNDQQKHDFQQRLQHLRGLIQVAGYSSSNEDWGETKAILDQANEYLRDCKRMLG